MIDGDPPTHVIVTAGDRRRFLLMHYRWSTDELRELAASLVPPARPVETVAKL